MKKFADEKGGLFLQFVQELPAQAWAKDMAGRYIYVNAAAVEAFGLSEEAILGRTDGEIFSEEIAENFRKNDRLALEQGSRLRSVEVRNDKNGVPRYSLVTKFPLHSDDGTTLVAGTAIDVTEQRNAYSHQVPYFTGAGSHGQADSYSTFAGDFTGQGRSEQLLRLSEGRVKILTDSFTDYAILSVDPKGVIVTWNPGGENIFGYSETEMIGRPIHDLFTPEDREESVPDHEMEEATRFGQARCERWQVKKDGSRFFASGVMVPLWVGGELSGYAKIATDLTEFRRQAEELQRAYEEMELRVNLRTQELADANKFLVDQINERRSAERLRIKLLQRIVTTQEDERRRIARDLHDQLGQRLTALRLKLSSLGGLCAGDAEMTSRVLRIQQIAELLDSEVSLIAWQLRPAALDELGLEVALETFVLEWARQNNKHAAFHNSGVEDLRLDAEVESQMYRIAQEALNNVAKHSDAKSASVILERVGQVLVLIVEDDGVGFDADSERSEGRHRLGLSGMKERADLIEGEFEVESKPGRGTSIYVRVPIRVSTPDPTIQ